VAALLADPSGSGGGSRHTTRLVIGAPALPVSVRAPPVSTEAAPRIEAVPPPVVDAVERQVPRAMAPAAGRPRPAPDGDLVAQLFRASQRRVRPDGSAVPILLRNRPPGVVASEGGGGGRDADALAADLAARADDIDVHDDELFARVPIEEYGAALLRGMGVDEAAIEGAEAPAAGGSGGAARTYNSRERLGAGAAPNPLRALDAYEAATRRPRKPGDAPLPPPPSLATLSGQAAPLSAATNANMAAAAAAAAATAATKARKFPGVVDGAGTLVLRGPHAGHLALITQTDGVPGLEKCRVRVVRGSTDGSADSVPRFSSIAATFLADPTEAGTEEVAVAKGACAALDSGGALPDGLTTDDAHALLAALRTIQAAVTARRVRPTHDPAAPPLPPLAVSVAPAPERDSDAPREVLVASHVGEPLPTDEVYRTRAVQSAMDADDDAADAPPAPPVNDAAPVAAAAPAPLPVDVGRRRTTSRSRDGDRRRRSVSRDRRRRSPSRDNERHRGHHHSSSGRERRDDEYDSRDRRDRHREPSRDERRRRERSRSRSRSPSRRSGRDRAREGDDRHHHRQSLSSHHSAPPPPPPRRRTWLSPGIAVRVVDEGWRGGSLFRCRGVVTDVPLPDVAVLRVTLPDGVTVRMVEGVPAAVLATALPKPGGAVRIVAGAWAGHDGTLVERRPATQTAVVALGGDSEGTIVTCDYEGVAELVL